MSFLLTLKHEDDLLAVTDRILTSVDDDVILAIPEGARILASEENFLLLKREVDAGGKRIAIRCSDPRCRLFAAKAKIPLLDASSLKSPARRVLSDIVAPNTPTTRLVPSPKPTPKPVPTSKPAPIIEAVSELEVDEEDAAPKHLVQMKSNEGNEGQGALPLSGADDEPLLFLEPTSAPSNSKRKMPSIALPVFNFRGFIGSKFIAPAIVLVGIALAFLVANQVLPSIEIKITPRSEVVSFTVPVTIAVGESSAPDTVPGQRISVSASEKRTVRATGEAEVTDRASGTITIVNAFSSASQTLVATTRFVSQSGKLYRLDNTTVVPGATILDGDIVASEINATVTADEPGPDFNIGPSNFSIPGFQGTPKFNKFTARSSEPISGGAKGKVRVILEQDIISAKEGLEAAVAEELERAFAAQVLTDFVVIDDARTLTVSVTANQDVGDTADEVTGSSDGTLSAVAYRQEDLENVVLESLDGRIPVDTDVVEDSTTMTSKVLSYDTDSGTLALEVTVEARAAWRVDEDLVREAVSGRDEAEIRSWLLDYDAVKRADMRFRPFWVTVAPDNPQRVEVVVGLDEA